jgi:Phage Mu protein F like protein
VTQPQPQPPPDQGTPPAPPPDTGMTALEKAFYAIVFAALAMWLTRVAAKVLTPWRLWKMMPDPSALWAVAPDWNRAVDTNLIPWLRMNAARMGWHRFYAEHAGFSEPGFVSTDSFVQAHLVAVRNYLVRIPQEVFEQIRRELIEGNDQGESIQQIAARVDQILTTTNSETWTRRAQVIAITEVNGASNAGWFAAARRTEADLNLHLDKVWLASHDDRVRPTHRAADGQRQPLNQPFIVGGWPLMYPGDKNGPPEEVINCRCTAGTEIR